MMGQIVKYPHHGRDVFVDEALKGRHRDHCLCYQCDKFHPNDRERNCEIANALYELCVNQHVVTPVYECAVFAKKKGEQ
jgi:hypothetical protein